ncbi:ABC transporter [Bradyrhizobium sp. CCBAU 21362]|nr:ABC transporter [Bradyrhizobium sp. CCBAU 21362]
MDRRRFLQATSSAIAGSALVSAPRRGRANSTGELRVNMSGGNFGEAIMKAFVKPFAAETGVKVTPIMQDVTNAQVGLMVKSGSVTIDVVLTGHSSALVLAANGYLEEIDYSIHKDLDSIIDYCRSPYGFGSYIYSWNMFCNTRKLPSSERRPTTWTEFWDVAKFPGKRSLPSGEYGSGGPWEEALLADGVPMDKLYPMDIDRVFASLDKIKPHIRKWWTTGAEILQIMRDNVADLGESYDGRALSLIDAGEPIEINRNQAKLYWDNWIIPKGSPNAANAQKFIALTSRADRQADFARLFGQSPSNRNAFKSIADDVARKLATYPAYAASSFPLNAKWYGETGSGGVPNSELLRQRWNAWIVR